MKILEHILNVIIRQQVCIDEVQFEFWTGRDTTDAVFILRKLQEKFTQKKKDVNFAFLD